MSTYQAHPEAERAVIAGLIRDPDGGKIIDLGITPDLFTSPERVAAFQAIATALAEGETPDAATLAASLDGSALIEAETSLSSHASSANLPGHVRLLQGAKRARDEAAARDRLSIAAAAGAPPHELDAILESIRAAGIGDAPPRLQWSGDFCADYPDTAWLVDEYLPAGSIGAIFGDSESWKSFLGVDLCGHVATGRPWRGHAVKQGKVLFIAGEGGSGLRQRIDAWFIKHGEHHRNFAVMITPLELCAPKAAGALVDEIKRFIGSERFELIVLDTLATHFGPGDENAAADMSCFVRSVLRLSHETGAAVAIVHHCGHGDKSRARGSIALHNGIDWEYRLERLGDYTTLSCTKQKDAPRPPPLSWQLATQPLPRATSTGVPINGAVLEPSAQTAQTRTVGQKSRLSGKVAIAENALRTALMLHGVEDNGIVTVSEDQWRQTAYSAGIASGDSTQNARRMAFNRARETLISARAVVCDDGRYWIPAPRTDRTDPHKTAQCADMCGLGMPEQLPAQTAQTAHTPIRGVRMCGCADAGTPNNLQEADPAPEPEPTPPQENRQGAEQAPIEPADTLLSHRPTDALATKLAEAAGLDVGAMLAGELAPDEWPRFADGVARLSVAMDEPGRARLSTLVAEIDATATALQEVKP